MTPANPDALADALARELARLDGWQDPDALWTDNLGIIARGGEGSPVYLDYVEDAGKLIAGPLAPLLADLQRVTAERDEAREEAYDLKLAAAGGEDVPGSANLVTAEDVRRWRDEETRALAAAEARAAQLQAEVEALKEDAARLDFLDGCNARLNASYGTHYGWKLVLNHNVNRLMLGDMKVDLHDSEGGNDKLPSCRLAIDQARARTALAARAATAREGQADG